MSRRVYEVAQEVGVKGRDLADKINGMGLGFTVNNHMSALTEEQEDSVKRALEREARDNMVEERISATVIRRKPRRRKVVADAVAPTNGAGSAPVAPVRAATRIPTPADAPVVVEPTVSDVPAPVVTELAAVEAPIEPVAEVAPEVTATVDAPVEPEPPREDVVEAVAAPPQDSVPEPVAAEVAPAAEDAPAAEADGEATGEAAPPAPTDDVQRPAHAAIIAALAKQQAQAEERGGAQVVGSLSPELLQARLAADRKTFGVPKPPTPPRATGTRETFEKEQAGRRKRKRGKKVYGANELYDGRSNRRRAQKKQAGGQATQITEAAEHKRVIKMEEAITVSDLAHQIGVKSGVLALKLMTDLGVRGANINTPLDFDTAVLLTDLFGFTVEQVGFDIDKYLPKYEHDDAHIASRPPVVTVMGHVDHGKTSLLDAIRSTDVAEGEQGGITQHIGAYKVDLESGTVVFLDTPGHEAFTALRARGAHATDLVVLVVAADDGVMPQTIEAINHSRDAEVPIVVAVNKIDKPGASTERIMQALTEYSLIPEAWGGDTLFQEVSALEHTNVDTLLEQILLQAEVLELKANLKAPAEGIVIESRLDTGRGPIATVLVQNGTLKPGAVIAVGAHWGRVRAMADERGRQLKEAPPATPVEITGLDGVPEAGERFYVVADERAARTIASHMTDQKRQKELAKSVAAPTDLAALQALLSAGELKELKIVIKSDVQGSQEALQQALTKLSTDAVKVKVVHAAVGGITENDINLAASSAGGAIVIGFNVRPETRATQSAEQQGISILTFQVIYDAVDAVTLLMTGLLEPIFEESALGRAEVREVFMIPKIGAVAGCYVQDGTLRRGAKARVVRDSKIIYESTISSLRRFKDDVREVKSGFECGLSVDNFNDIKNGDVIEVFELIEVAATL